MGRFRFVGMHADTLDNGQPVEPGQIVELSEDDAKANDHLVADGLLISAEEPTPPPSPKATSSKTKKGDES